MTEPQTRSLGNLNALKPYPTTRTRCNRSYRKNGAAGSSFRRGISKAHIAALRDGLIETEARRIVREMKRHYEPNSPNKTHFMAELSPAFMRLAATKDTDRLFSMLPYKTLSFSKIEGRHGTYALIDKGENRDREIRKPRPSIRAQLKADKAKTAPKKAAAKTKNHDMEV